MSLSVEENTRLVPYVHTVYTADAPVAALATHRDGPAVNKPNPGKQTLHVHSLRTH